MSEAGGPLPPAGAGARRAAPARFLKITAWVTWLAVLLGAVVLLWLGWRDRGAKQGAVLFIYGLALLALVPYVPLRALRSWRSARARRRLPEGWESGSGELPGWPGLRESGGRIAMRCGGGSFRLWALAAGLGASAWLLGRLADPQLRAFDLVLSLAPALAAAGLSALWGPSGWLLTVDAVKASAELVRHRPLRRMRRSSVSLPTIQGVLLPRARGRARGYWSIIVERARGPDWKLGVPGGWPADLVEALAARLASIAGVKLRTRDRGPAAGGPIPDPRTPDPEP